MIREHLRSNAIAYLALFVAMGGGTAFAADTVFSEDIVNGQVKTNDISNSNGVRSADVRDDTEADGGLAAVDLAANSVGGSEIAAGSVGTPEIARDAVDGPEIATDAVHRPDIVAGGVGGDEIGTNEVGSPEIATDAVDAPEIETDGVGADEIAADSVGGSEIAFQSVGGEELRIVIERRSQLVSVTDGTAHDGAYGKASATVSCQPGEVLLNVSVDWLSDADHNETALADEELEYFSNEQTATVSGAFDGGDQASFQAVAACLSA